MFLFKVCGTLLILSIGFSLTGTNTSLAQLWRL
jgi:hypothetical protein